MASSPRSRLLLNPTSEATSKTHFESRPDNQHESYRPISMSHNSSNYGRSNPPENHHFDGNHDFEKLHEKPYPMIHNSRNQHSRVDDHMIHNAMNRNPANHDRAGFVEQSWKSDHHSELSRKINGLYKLLLNYYSLDLTRHNFGLKLA